MRCIGAVELVWSNVADARIAPDPFALTGNQALDKGVFLVDLERRA
jgi:hypothetical protein